MYTKSLILPVHSTYIKNHMSTGILDLYHTIYTNLSISEYPSVGTETLVLIGGVVSQFDAPGS